MNPSDCLRKKDASPQSSAGLPTSFSICELSYENLPTNFQSTQATSSPSHKLELSKTMLARATSDEEMVWHTLNRQRLQIKLGRIFGCLTPNRFHADVVRHLNERIQHARAHAMHFTTRWPDGIRVRGCKVEHDMMTPRSPAKTESKNWRRLVPHGASNHHKYNLGVCLLLNRSSDFIRRDCRSANRPVSFPSFVCQLAVFERVLNVGIIGQVLREAPATQPRQIILCCKDEFNGQVICADAHAEFHGDDLIPDPPGIENAVLPCRCATVCRRRPGRCGRSPASNGERGPPACGFRLPRRKHCFD